MLTGRSFRLRVATVGIDSDDRKAVITLPAGTVVKVVDDPEDPSGMVDVLPGTRRLCFPNRP